MIPDQILNRLQIVQQASGSALEGPRQIVVEALGEEDELGGRGSRSNQSLGLLSGSFSGSNRSFEDSLVGSQRYRLGQEEQRRTVGR